MTTITVHKAQGCTIEDLMRHFRKHPEDYARLKALTASWPTVTLRGDDARRILEPLTHER